MPSSADASWAVLAALALGYLLGSVPFGLILTRMGGAGDVRAIGSGNIGATNVLRTGRKDLAAATLLLDALKGTVAVVLARRLGGEGAAFAAALGAFLGHIFPVWLGFRGGKGVATYLGVVAALVWPAALAFALVWLGLAFVTRYSSAAALGASLTSVLTCALLRPPAEAIALAAMALLLWWTHRQNIGRLLAGKESRIGRAS